MHPGPPQTAGNRTIGRNFHPKKNPDQKYLFFVEKTWFECQVDAPKIWLFNGLSIANRPPPEAGSQTTTLILILKPLEPKLLS